MEDRKTLIVAGVIAVIALVLLGGLIFYLVKAFVGGSSSSSSTTNITTSSPIPNTGYTPSQGNQASPAPSNTKTYNGSNFQLSYPSSWGLLTCSNSANFELDPTSGVDQKIGCTEAIKPVTIMVGNSLGCGGTTMSLGNNSVLYSKQTDSNGYISYQWCTQNSPEVINFTERVSPNNDKATSVRDYSTEVQQIISSLKFGGGS